MKLQYKLQNLFTFDYQYINDDQINFEFNFNKDIPVLPNTIKIINFGHKFNKKIDILPNSLIELKTHGDFDNYVDNLPMELKTLEFKYKFNKNIDNLPNNLIHLNLSYYFNQDIKNLPNNLIGLSLSCVFDKSIAKIPNILYLIYKGNMQLNNLPKSIKKLDISNNRYDKLLDFLPEGIEKLYIDSNILKINDLPSSIKEIHIYKHNIKNINKIYHNKIILIKSSVPVKYSYMAEKFHIYSFIIKYFITGVYSDNGHNIY